MGQGVAAAAALALGYAAARVRGRRRLAVARREAAGVLEAARREAEVELRRLRLEQDAAAAAARAGFEGEMERREAELTESREDVEKAEQVLDEGQGRVEGRAQKVEARRAACETSETAIRAREKEEVELHARVRAGLLARSGLTEEAARALLEKPLEEDLARELGVWTTRTLEGIESEAERRAGRLIGIAIGRCQVSHYGEPISSQVSLEDERARARILAAESRTADVFKEELGVELAFDEESKHMAVVAADGVKREIARQALEDLVESSPKEGAIPPERAKDRIARQARSMEKKLVKVGKWAAREAKVGHLHPSLLPLLGRMRYRSSYGQNALYHSIEVAHLMALLAAELGLDVSVARRAGLLHDIGKAVDREREGGHPEIGAEILKEAGEHESVVLAALGHHLDPATQPLFPVLVGAADAVSASRAGARRETGDRYAQRLETLERLAYEEPGVSGAYAIQGGREFRVLVDAEAVDDEKAVLLARKIGQKLVKLQEESPFPGQMKITLIREKRVVEVAK